MMAAEKKGRGGCRWFLLGALLGPFGFIIALLSDPIDEPSTSRTAQNIEASLTTPAPPTIRSVSIKDNESCKTYEQKARNLDQKLIDDFITNWPLNPKSYSLEFADDNSFVQLKRFDFRNIQNRAIEYSEWKVLCFDILSRPIPTAESIVLKIENRIHSGEVVGFYKSIILPPETKKVTFILLNVLFADGEILNTVDVPAIHVSQKLNKIDQLDTQKSFVTFLEKQLELKDTPIFFHEYGSQGFWTCSFCGVLNNPEATECQCCKSPISAQEEINEKNIIDLFTLWKTEQIKIRQIEELAKQRQKAEEDERLKKENLERERLREIMLEKERRQSRLLVIWLVVFVVLAIVSVVAWQLILKDVFAYKKGLEQYESGQYLESAQTFSSIIGFKDSRRLASDSYVLYIQNSIDDYNADDSISTASTYSWVLAQGYPRDLIFESITKIDDKLVEDEKGLIRLWLDQNDFHSFLPTIKLVSKEGDNKEIMLGEIGIEKFTDYYTLPEGNYENISKYGHDLFGWEFLFEGQMKKIPPGTRIRSLVDQKIYAIWNPKQVGEIGPAGGIIVYDKGTFSDGWQFIEVAPTETEWTNVPWSGFMNRNYGLGSAIGDGKSNTDTILEKTSLATARLPSFQYAPHLCANLNYNGFDDWLLPSKGELDLIYRNLHLTGMGEFKETNYWTSTDMNEFSAWVQRFSNGFQFGHDKYKLANARAIRYF